MTRGGLPPRWVITGGCGFLGTALIRALLARAEVRWIRVLDNLSVGTRNDLEWACGAGGFVESGSPHVAAEGAGRNATSRVELVAGDIGDGGLAETCCRDSDVVVHLAARTSVPASVENPRKDLENNVTGLFNVLEGARKHGVGRFVFASSGAPLGDVEPPVHERLAPRPVSPYGASKLAGEGYCSAFYHSFGLETVALRFGNVYGPGSGHKGSVVAKFLKRAMAGEHLEIYGDGKQTRDFIFIDDLVTAIFAATVVEGVGGEVFQIATSEETTVGDLARQLVDVLASRGVEGVQVTYGAARTGDIVRNYSDTGKARSRLGWQAKTALKDGLTSTADWFLQERVLRDR